MTTNEATALAPRIRLGDVTYPRLEPAGYCGGAGCCGSDEADACVAGSHSAGPCRCTPTSPWGHAAAYDDRDPDDAIDLGACDRAADRWAARAEGSL